MNARANRTVLRDPVKVVVGASENSACDNIEQRLVFAGTEPGKLIALRDLLVKGIRTPLLIFVQTKSRARQLAHTLRQHPHPIKVGYIEADQTQAQRDQVVRQFRGGDLNALITTEVLARGIDFLGVNCVINYGKYSTARAFARASSGPDGAAQISPRRPSVTFIASGERVVPGAGAKRSRSSRTRTSCSSAASPASCSGPGATCPPGSCRCGSRTAAASRS